MKNVTKRKKLKPDTVAKLISIAEWSVEQDLDMIQEEIVGAKDLFCAHCNGQLVGVAFTRRHPGPIHNILYLVVDGGSLKDDLLKDLLDCARSENRWYSYIIALSDCPGLNAYLTKYVTPKDIDVRKA